VSKRSPIVSDLCSRWHARAPHFAIRRAVTSTFDGLDRLPLPIQLGPLAYQRNIIRIVPSQIPVDGIISSADGKTFRIEVNRDHGPERQRFTCAHEIGHTFFFELDRLRQGSAFRLQESSLENLPTGSDEEYLCNLAAAEILLPFGHFHAQLELLGLSTGSLPTLARRFGVSLQAASRRLAQLSEAKLAVVLWEQDPGTGAYRSIWEAGHVAKDRFPRALEVHNGDPLFSLFQAKRAFSQRCWVSLGGPRDCYFADGTPLRLGAIHRFLTIFVLGDSPEKVIGSKRVPLQGSDQLDLF
jgi:Zn-dependent peptidase ImmA (M78 family)